MMTDPIADMLTRIRNANAIRRANVNMPYSHLKEAILAKMKQEGFINDYEIIQQTPCNIIKVTLRFSEDGEKVIREIMRVSTPGRRIYQGYTELKKVLGGMGIAILSTSKGIMTDRECRKNKIGGELLCQMW
jgi:small subunit ribosomal protein S8